MGKGTSIEWCHHTFNPWWGCTRVSPGCEHCYAETFSKRVGLKVWGQRAGRRFFGERHWAEPLKWNRDAERAGERRRVFCASMADVFEDRRDLDAPRARLWSLIEETPWLDWLLLTKRPENHELVPLAWQTGSRRPGNVWLGCTAENQEYADRRIPELLRAPWPAVRFVSYEPALGPVEFAAYIFAPMRCHACGSWSVHYDTNPKGLPEREPCSMGVPMTGEPGAERCSKCSSLDIESLPALDWIIVGGESGPGARPFELEWAAQTGEQCRQASVPYFVKQLGSQPFNGGQRWAWNQHPMDRKGGDPEQWPEDLRVRQFPRVQT